MADNWRDRLVQSGGQVAGPGGYQQQAAQVGRETGDWRAVLSDNGGQVAAPGGTRGGVAWGTGGNIEDIENGWNTPFYAEMFKQRNEAANAGTLNELYSRKDFTGIVTTDPADKSDPKKTFGAIYDNGVYQGNVYDGRSFNRQNADWLMGRLTLDKEVFAKQQSPEALAREVERVRKESSEFAARGEGARAFQTKVDQTSDEVQGNAAFQVGNVAAGAGGGALVGAGIGSIVPIIGTTAGAIVGGVIGGLSAWLNQDEVADTIAQVTEQTNLAAEQGLGALSQGFTGLAGAGQIGMKYLMPVGNLVHGLYDATTEGSVGNGDAG